MSAYTVKDYASLEQAVSDFLTRADITDSNYLPVILQMGQERIYKGYKDTRGAVHGGLRVRQMLKALPAGNIDSISLGGTLTGYSGSVVALTFGAPPAGGVQAAGYGIVTAGTLTAVVLTNPGLGYVTPPTITPASGAAVITCTVSAIADISPSGNWAVPADYLELDHMDVVSQQGPVRLERKPAEWIKKYYGTDSTTGVPNYVGRDGAAFIFAPSADSGYQLGGFYFYQDAYLSSSYTSNFLTQTYPLLLLTSCLAVAAHFTRNADAEARWEGMYSELMESVMAMEEQERFSGSPMAMVPG